MILDAYRDRLALFNEEIHREHYLYFSGQKEDLALTRIYNEYADLFTLDAIKDLKKIYSDISPLFFSQRSSVKKLIAFAVDNYLQTRTKELSEKIDETESKAKVRWDGREIGFYESSVVLTNESDKDRRRQLYALKSHVIAQTNDLRRERAEKQREGCATLGYKTYLEAYTDILAIDYLDFARRLKTFLEKSEAPYTTLLANALVREINLPLEEAHRSDVGYFTRMPRFDPFFSKSDLIECYRTTLEGLGIDARRQENIELDLVPRERKHPRAFCAPINIPNDIKLVIQPQGGQQDYATFFHEAGHAQHFAWTARSLTIENKACGDRAVSETYAFLFNYLIMNDLWLDRMLHFSDSEEFLQRQTLFKLHILRRYAAKVNYEVALHSGSLKQEIADTYGGLLSEATKFQYDPVEYLYDVDDGFYSADYLRAWIFESRLRDHLKTHFGKDWFQSKKAGDFLKEIWETGEQYSADELASQIGLGKPDVSALLEQT